MKDLIRLYREPGDAVVETGSPMLDAMNEAEAAAKPAEDAKPTEDAKPAGKFAWGDEDRRKTRDALKDDDEIDLGYEDEKDGAKLPAKLKYADLKTRAKWLKENDGMIRAANSMREEFTKNPDLKKAFESFWGKAYPDNKYNPEAVANMLSKLEAKAEAVAAKVEDNADDIAEAEKELAELDQDSPQYKIAKRSLNALKAVRAQLAEAQTNNKTLQGKLDGLDKFKTGFEETQKKQTEDADAKQAGELFNSTFGALTSGEQGIKFDDADDTKEFEESVRNMVANLAADKKITNDAEFTKAIQDSAKVAQERINKRNQRVVTEYLKKKGLTPKEGEKPKEEVKEKSSDDESIGDAILREMSEQK